METAIEITRILRLHSESWGSEHMNIFFIQPITLSLYAFMDEGTQSPEQNARLTDLCIMFRAISRRWTVGMNILRMVQLSAKHRGFRLPPETDDLFEKFETEDWLGQESKRVISMYPDAASATFKTGIPSQDNAEGRKEPQVRNMTDFLELMDNLNIQGKGKHTVR